MPSTAVWTTISSSPTRSSPAANDSPTRRIASCSRVRSCCRSSRRASSCLAIELNSVPRAANSSLPSAGTVTEKSPRAEPLRGHQQTLDLRLQAPRDGDREDEGKHEEADEGGGRGQRGAARRGRARVGEQQPDRDRAADRGRAERLDAVVGPVDLGGALHGQVGRRGGPCRSHPRVAVLDHHVGSGQLLDLARELLGRQHGDGEAPGRLPPARRAAAARPAPWPAGRLTRSAPTRRGAARVLGLRLVGQLVEPALDRTVADGHRVGEPLILADLVGHRAGLGLELAQDLLRRRAAPARAGHRSGCAPAATIRPEQDDGHRDHRDHDDDHEEEPEAAPEARSAALKSAHRGRPEARSLHTTSWQLQSLVHGMGRKPCLPRGYSSVGRAPGSHPGGRGFESP